jgi:hypothetical protein
MTEEQIEESTTSEETLNVEEEVEVVESNEPTLEDYQKALKQIETLKAQKEHFKKKATQKGDETNKTNTPTGLTREEAILFAKGLDEDDINLAAKIAKVEGISLIKATEDEHFQFKLQQKQQEIKSKGAKLGASTGGGYNVPTNMSDEEHEAYARKILNSL